MTQYTLAQFQSQRNLDKHSMLGNPLFSNVNSYDFHLAQNSPIIDKAYNLGSLVSNDFDGTSRPQGLGFDMGALEVISTTPPPVPPPNNFKIWLPVVIR